MSRKPLICIFGAGSIGCYVGGRLAATGTPVSFIARTRIAQEISAQGLHLTDFHGADLRVSAAGLQVHTSPESAASADLILVTVKSAATEEVGHSLAPLLKPGTVVISFQNGMHNAEVLRGLLPGCVVLTGMVPFNVVNRGQGAFHQGSEGDLEVEASPTLAPFTDAFTAAGLALRQCQEMLAVQWAKLLLNLNNPVNALSNLPLKQQLSQRAFRRCVALAQREGLALLPAIGVTPAKLTPLPPHWIPRLMDVPDFWFKLLANKMLAIDPLARSSMWEDLELGRKTEVEYINGEVVRLAEKLGRRAPVNAKLKALIHAAEQGGRRDWSGDELLHELVTAR